ncbi:hypothetical protein FRB95_003965 [Tulasnella sp. JGI-2019a]|nr:hypothetical protein FRB95_003965 [Tulasnella sp. JGI-2019a]
MAYLRSIATIALVAVSALAAPVDNLSSSDLSTHGTLFERFVDSCGAIEAQKQFLLQQRQHYSSLLVRKRIILNIKLQQLRGCQMQGN